MKFLLSYILINFILILTFYIIYFTNKSTNKENFAAVDKLTIKEYVTSDIIKEKLFLMTDTDGNLSTVNKLNERLDIIKNNIEANTAAIKANIVSIAVNGVLINANSINIAATAASIQTTKSKIADNERNIKVTTSRVNTATSKHENIETKLEKLRPLLGDGNAPGKLCGTKGTASRKERGTGCMAIRYNDFMSILNYGAEERGYKDGWYLRTIDGNSDSKVKLISPTVLEDKGDESNRGINTVFSIIPQIPKKDYQLRPNVVPGEVPKNQSIFLGFVKPGIIIGRNAWERP